MMVRQFITSAFAAIALAALVSPSHAQNTAGGACDIPAATVAKVQSQLSQVVTSGNGGIFTPNRMWSAVVDRKGVLCSVIAIGDAWPGSRAVAIAKASTANDFSNGGAGGKAISTANLYAPTQPGGSLYGLNNSNPYNPLFDAQGLGVGFVPGGIITFGGGVALYVGSQVIGGLGVSGDTSCADHAIAYKMRRAAGLDGIPGGFGLNGTDNIVYLTADEPANTGFAQPHCLPTDVTP